MTTIVEMPESEEQIQIAQFKKNAVEIYLKSGKEELAKYLEEVDVFRKEERVKKNEYQKSHNTENRKIFVHCPKCGYRFQFLNIKDGKITGGISGASAGALLGAKIGIAMRPLGAIAGTIPGAILGSIFGKNIGNNFDKPICPNCETKSQAPNNLQSYISNFEMSEIIVFYKTITVDEIIEESKIATSINAKLEKFRNKLSGYKAQIE
jgi:hypothetical protein